MSLIIISVLLLIVGLLLIRYSRDSEFEKTLKTIGYALLVMLPIVWLIGSAVVVDSGEVKVARLFGKVQKEVLREGLHFVNPLKNWETVNIQRNSIQVQDGDESPGMKSTTKDNIQATVQANFAFMVNPDYAWWVTKYIGKHEKVISELIEKASQSATRDALAHFQLEEAQITMRTKFEKMLRDQFAENILANLPLKEISSKELEKIFLILPTQLMEVTPDLKVANALSEKKATEITLTQQITLTDIAKEQAKRRKEEGTGIRKLFEELPAGRSAADVALILDATANKTRAEALMKAVTDGKVTFGVFEGNNAGKVVR